MTVNLIMVSVAITLEAIRLHRPRILSMTPASTMASLAYLVWVVYLVYEGSAVAPALMLLVQGTLYAVLIKKLYITDRTGAYTKRRADPKRGVWPVIVTRVDSLVSIVLLVWIVVKLAGA